MGEHPPNFRFSLHLVNLSGLSPHGTVHVRSEGAWRLALLLSFCSSFTEWVYYSLCPAIRQFHKNIVVS